MNPHHLELWSAPNWSVIVNRKQAGLQKLEQPLPYARIGSHPDCEVHIDNPRIPAFAYLLCAYSGIVESWPLAPIAMARSGRFRPGDQLVVGSCKISVEIDAEQSEQPDSSDPGPDYPRLEVSVPGGQSTTKLKQAITIVGDDHPSLMRIHDAGLRQCHGALISIAGGLWFLDLEDTSSANLAQPIEAGQALAVGDLSIRRLPDKDSDPMTVFQIPKRSSGETPSESLSTVPDETPAQGEAALRSPTDVPTEAATLNQAAAVKTPGRVGSTEVPVEAYMHGYTHDITHRTIQMGKRRQVVHRIRRGAIFCVATAIAIVVLIMIFNAVRVQGSNIPWR